MFFEGFLESFCKFLMNLKNWPGDPEEFTLLVESP